MTMAIQQKQSIQCSECGATYEYSATLRGLCPSCLLARSTDKPVKEVPSKSPSFVPPLLSELAPHFTQLEVVELIGNGGMSAVYKAIQKSLGRTVALKVLPPEVASAHGGVDRFQREGKMLAQLNHPNIVQVLDAGQAGPWYFILMEYIAGPNLRQVIGNSRLPEPESLRIAASLCDALQYAHDRAIIHRDIKPENVLLGIDGVVKLADFGLARVLQSPLDVRATQSGQVLGTAQYIAPEQFESPAHIDHRADLYALGVLLYEMMTGEVPMGNFLSPSHRSGSDPALDAIVLKALSRDRNQRFQHARDLRSHLMAANETSNSDASAHFRGLCDDGSDPALPKLAATKTSAPRTAWELLLSLCSLTAACIGFVGIGNLIDSFAMPAQGPRAQILFGFPLMTLATAIACILAFFFSRMSIHSASSWSEIRWSQLPSVIPLVTAYALFTFTLLTLPGMVLWLLASVPKLTLCTDWQLFGNTFTELDRLSFVTKYWFQVFGVGAFAIAGWNLLFGLCLRRNPSLLVGAYHPTSPQLTTTLLTRLTIATGVLGLMMGLVLSVAATMMNRG